MRDLSIDRLIANFQIIKNHLDINHQAFLSIRISLIFIFSFLLLNLPFLSIVFFIPYLIFFKFSKSDLILILLTIGFLLSFPKKLDFLKPTSSIAYIQIVTKKAHPKGFRYMGNLKGFRIENKVYFTDEKLNFFLTKEMESFDGEVLVSGILEKKQNGYFSISKIRKIEIVNKESFLQTLILRQRSFLEKRLGKSKNFGESLLKACLFGFQPEKEITMIFSKLGLSHILAISGFHFSLIAMIFSKIFQRLLPNRFFLIALILFISCYALFVGTSPSIIRAYFSISLATFALFIRHPSDGLNILFVSFMLLFLKNPDSLNSLSLQLSFLATFGILTFYDPLIEVFDQILKKRMFNEAIYLDHFSQWGYIFLQILKKMAALNISATLLTLPIILYHFKSISILSFYYNLFFPTIIGILMTFGFIAILFDLIFSFPFLYETTCKILNEVIQLLIYYPRKFDFPIENIFSSPFSVIFCEDLFIFLGLYLKFSKIKKRQIEQIKNIPLT